MKAKMEVAVCDLGDGEVSVKSITWKTAQGEASKVNDLCQGHYNMLEGNAHAPTRGRQVGFKVKKSAAKSRAKKR